MKKYEIIERTWEGCEVVETTETEESAIAACEKLYTEECGWRFSSEESIEVWCEGKCLYIAGEE